MPAPKRLTLFVEGQADRLAASVLVKRLLSERDAPPWDAIVLDDDPPFVVGNLSGLMTLHKPTNTIQFASLKNCSN